MVDVVSQVGVEFVSKGAGAVQRDINSMQKGAKDLTLQSRLMGTSLGQAFTQAKNLSQAATGGIKGLAGGIGGLTVAAGGAAVAIAGIATAMATVAAAVATFTIVKNRLSEINDLVDQMQNLGGATQSLRELAGVYALSGQSVDKLSGSLQKLQNNLALIIESNDEVAAAMGRAGIDMRQLAELAASDVAAAYTEVISKLANVEDGNDRALISQKLLGKSMADSAKIAADAADYHYKLALAQELGIVTTQELEDKAVALDGAYEELAGAVLGLKNQLALAFGDETVSAVRTFADMIIGMNRYVRDLSDEFSGLGGVIGVVLKRIPGIAMAANMVDKMSAKGRQVRADAEAAASATVRLSTVKVTGPVTNETNTDRDKRLGGSSKAATKQLSEYDQALKRIGETANRLREDGVLENLYTWMSGDTGTTSQQQADQFKAAADAIRGMGLEVEGQIQLENGLWSATAAVTAEYIKQNKLSESQAQTLRNKATAAAEYAAQNAKIAQDERARVTTLQTVAGFNQKAEMYARATALLNDGRFRSEEEITRYMNDQAYAQDLINKAKAEGLSLTQQEAMLQARAVSEASSDAFEQAKRPVIENFEFYKQLASGVGDTMGSSITNALQTGRFDFKSFLGDIANMLVQSGIKKLMQDIFSPSAGSSSGGFIGNLLKVFGAVGGMSGGASYNGTGAGTSFDVSGYANLSPSYNARGGVINSPTMLGMQGNRRAVGGEAGPEGVLPLARGRNGKLGVIAQQGNGGPVLNIMPGAVVVNSTGNSREDEMATARAMDQLIETKMKRFMADQSRPGNSLNPVRSY